MSVFLDSKFAAHDASLSTHERLILMLYIHDEVKMPLEKQTILVAK